LTPTWERLAGPFVGRLLQEDPACVGLVPVGATEQHGPHLPTGTDTIIATALCDALGAHGVMVLPALAVGCSWFHGRELAGTLAIAPEQLAALAAAWADWAASSGLRRLLFVNAHVGNSAALSTATDRLRFERPDLRVGVLEWWSLASDIAAEATADCADWHGNRAETSIMLAIAPELVDTVAAKTADDEDRATGLVFRYGASAVSTNGVTGRPSEATAELGERLWARVVDAAGEVVRRARTEEPPLAPG
jgi:creatinine amidohydrolase